MTEFERRILAEIERIKLRLQSVSQIPDGSITSQKIADGTIMDADISASAGIAQSKISNAARAIDADMVDGYHAATSGGNAHVLATDASGNATVSGGLNVGSASGAGTGQIKASGELYQAGVPLGRRYGARVLLYTRQSISANTWVALSFGYELNDHGNCWSSANPTRLYAPVTGYYDVGGGFAWENDQALEDGKYVLCALRRNGSTWLAMNDLWMPKSGNDYLHMSISAGRVYMGAGDYVEVMCRHNCSSSKYVGAATFNANLEHRGFGYIEFASL